ncbi:hypothetical protein F7725_022787 [Dissostichus mawsoni]|uniref:Uncharacterized protein n=1 Tax=Dissostichus mawsoni TaxID=36200 RepID=A0A7J5YYS7_DISMA|nr:hypothetical protein F7725_022787 [Dissostichus mawsoni]
MGSLTTASMVSRAVLSRGITAHHLSKNVTFYVNELESPVSGCQNKASEDHKPLMLMLPWLGARPQAVAKYCEIYFRTGFDVLVVEIPVASLGSGSWEEVARVAPDRTLYVPPTGCPCLLYRGYTFAQLLIHVSQDIQKYQDLTQRIKGQVYDSLVVGSVETMAIGLGKTLFPRLETLVTKASMLYFGMFKRQTVDYFNKSIDTFWDTPITVPALFFFCENDPMSDPRAMEEIIDRWRKRGIDTTAKKWKESTHAGHLKRHQQEYLTTIDMYLHTLGFTQLKAKM